TGVCAIGASLFYLLGVQADAPSAVVASSLFPVLSVGVGVVVFRDRARPVQLLGALVSVAGVVAVVAG
ncbi:MAG TPA: hypothetical protein DEP66_06050, partial [Acidimicrobiaceae bacterium]|nr:hypothetical protein [Acidimicrobiaceae bacterium]